MTKEHKTVHLEVNEAGGWRRVMSFDAKHDAQGDRVMQLTDELLRCGSNQRIKARIIMPGDTAPLLSWEASMGWQAWRCKQGEPA